MRDLLTIGEAATLAGVTPKAIRHYHKLGLLEEPERSEAGYRLYSARDLLRLQRIRRLKSLGLSLERVKAVLGEPGNARPLREVLKSLLSEVSRDIEKLEERKRRIEGLLANKDLEASISSQNKPYALELLEEHFGEYLTQTSSELREQGERFWAHLEDFKWPPGYRASVERLILYYAERPAHFQTVFKLEERLAALANEPEDSPEVGRLAKDYADLFAENDLLPEQLLESPPWMSGPLGSAFAELAATNLSPAQKRCLELMSNLLEKEEW